ncbi:uncharacterized protein G2W53_006022 [Senna tora]|uniref:DUF1677 family protein n=1 Tax=Senna tora TaxID=362788 RepID=A0A835CEE1_9FABA|nr:uncharacterized protein G2W53_006022 [Senna tora]
MAISGSEAESAKTQQAQSQIQIQIQTEVECVKCESCGFTEDCTLAYIARLRQRFQGRWLCGLCVEAVKDEALRSRNLTLEQALDRHITFCAHFRSSTRSALTQTEHPIFAMGRILRRNLESPRYLRSNSTGDLPKVHPAPTKSLARSESCFPTIPG